MDNPNIPTQQTYGRPGMGWNKGRCIMTNRQRLALANRVQRRIQLYYYSLREAGGKEESGGIRKNKTFAPCTVVDEPGADQAAVDHR